MAYILGSNLPSNQLIRTALTLLFGVGSKKAHSICDQLGLSAYVRVAQLTKTQLDRIVKTITSNDLIDAELKRVVQEDVKRFVRIGCYRGFRHHEGLPLRGQRTHTNAKTCRKLRTKIGRW